MIWNGSGETVKSWSRKNCESKRDHKHVCAGQQVITLILQAGTSYDLLTLVSKYEVSVHN